MDLIPYQESLLASFRPGWQDKWTTRKHYIWEKNKENRIKFDREVNNYKMSKKESKLPSQTFEESKEENKKESLWKDGNAEIKRNKPEWKK